MGLYYASFFRLSYKSLPTIAPTEKSSNEWRDRRQAVKVHTLILRYRTTGEVSHRTMPKWSVTQSKILLIWKERWRSWSLQEDLPTVTFANTTRVCAPTRSCLRLSSIGGIKNKVWSIGLYQTSPSSHHVWHRGPMSRACPRIKLGAFFVSDQKVKPTLRNEVLLPPNFKLYSRPAKAVSVPMSPPR